jgi:hypothetical protein
VKNKYREGQVRRFCNGQDPAARYVVLAIDGRSAWGQEARVATVMFLDRLGQSIDPGGVEKYALGTNLFRMSKECEP